jgi:hypothetical protein
MQRCAEDGCDGRRVHSTHLCEQHYRATLASVRADLSAGRQRRRMVVPERQRLRKEVRALRLARAVHDAGHLTREQAAQAAGIKPGGLANVLAYAREHGWIVARPGGQGGGFVPGTVVPTRESAA